MSFTFPTLPTNIDETYPNRSGADRLHQQHHDAIHQAFEDFNASGVGDVSEGSYVPPFPADVDSPTLPGRPIAAAMENVAIPANMVVGVYFTLATPGDPWRLIVSVQTAATAGSVARVWVASWDKATRTATLVRDFGTVSIDSSAATAIDITYGGAAADLPAGDYVICFVPENNVTMRGKRVHDCPDGFQSGGEAFNLGENRLFSMPYNQQGSFPGAALATVTLTGGTSMLAGYALAIVLAKWQ